MFLGLKSKLLLPIVYIVVIIEIIHFFTLPEFMSDKEYLKQKVEINKK